ncbi:MAG: hypothetical protein H6825_12560 [Planctomycetes bacterium]|nr:hypothetical protein [Planctomycetota bacterium]
MSGALPSALALTLLACAGCAAAERGFYAPVGAAESPSLVHWTEGRPDELVFEVACQGSYLNQVAGRPARTMHVQLEVLRPREGAVTLALDALRLTLQPADGGAPIDLLPSEAWWGDERLERALRIPGWSRRAFDLFFDDPDAESAPPALARLRWTWQAGGDTGYGDCQFRRIPAGGPGQPSLDPLGDAAFGYRDGFYMPIEGDLGPRALQKGVEVREHYVFHDPEGWFVGWF